MTIKFETRAGRHRTADAAVAIGLSLAAILAFGSSAMGQENQGATQPLVNPLITSEQSVGVTPPAATESSPTTSQTPNDQPNSVPASSSQTTAPEGSEPATTSIAPAPNAAPLNAATPAVSPNEAASEKSTLSEPAPTEPAASQISYGDDEAPAPAALKTSQPSSTVEIKKEQLPHNLSPWGMFLAADIVVKAVMISLAIASILVWTAWIGKLIQVAFARTRTRRQTRRLETLPTIASAQAAALVARDPVSAMVREAMRELDLSEHGLLSAGGIKERVASRLSRIEASAGRVMNAGTGLLATVGGTAPFIGLFGTVWGIMNSFIGISKAQTTNLAVVAPGIAEALLATAIGLVAAIPAVIFYNQLARAITGYKAALADAAAVIERHVSRDLDRQNRVPNYHQFKAAE